MHLRRTTGAEDAMDCKVGDMALVIGSIADNLGRLVVVLSREVRFDGAPGWLVRCVAGRTLGGRSSLDAPIRPCSQVVFADGHLKPIPGLSAGAPTATALPVRRDTGEPATQDA